MEDLLICTEFLGKCGFYCGVCPTFLNGRCKGCEAEHSAGDCFSRDCVTAKGLRACGECDSFPCETILKKPRSTVLDKSWMEWKKKEKNHVE